MLNKNELIIAINKIDLLEDIAEFEILLSELYHFNYITLNEFGRLLDKLNERKYIIW
jgi:hypothetical protein